MPQVHEFFYKGYNCKVVYTDYGYWGSAYKDEHNKFEHMFPEKYLDDEIRELKFSIDTRLNG